VDPQIKALIARGLGKVSAADRAALREALKLVDGNETLQRAKPGEATDWLFSGIAYELNRRGRPYPDFLEHKINQMAPCYLAEAPQIRAQLVLRVFGSRRFTPTDRMALGRVVAAALADYVVGPAPLSLQVLLQNVSKVWEALDAAFPGYLEAGALGATMGKWVNGSG
jgi:hypothetical protein